MARGRMIDKRISNSKKLGKITDKAARLYFMIYPHLDQKGRIAFDDLDDLKTEVTPRLKGWNLKKIGSSLNELADINLIQLYTDQGKIAIQFERFKDFQTIREDREAASKIAAPGKAPESSGVFRITSALSLSSIKPKEGKNEDEFEKEFESFWEYYRSIGNPKDDIGSKEKAQAAYKTLRKRISKKEMSNAARGEENYLKYKRLEENFSQRKKFASTWLKSNQWKEHQDFEYKAKL